MFSLTPDKENSSRQNWLVKIGPMLLTIELGIPCSHTKLSKKTWTTDVDVYRWTNDKKWAYFENLSTTVRMTNLPWTKGKPSMKFMAMSAQTADGRSSGWSKLAECNCFVLFCSQTAHDLMKFNSSIRASRRWKST
jgi:hypothetical protein